MAEDNSVIVEPEKAEKAGKAEKSSKRGSRKKIGIIAGVVVVVIAVAGIGFWNWHNTPEFCNAICHNPQDPYNPTYYAEPGQAATDKWGNNVADATGMLAAVHRTNTAKANCLSCHEPTLQEQISEGIEWVSGNFYNPLSERSLSNLTRWTGDEATSFCLKSGCHNYTIDTLTTLTARKYGTRNPHSWHHSEYTCSDCHKSHRASVMVCSECHDDATVPTGWISAKEASELETTYLSYDQEQLIHGK